MQELPCEGLLFDLDGVLIDSSSCISRHWQEWSDRHGVELARVMAIAHGVRTVETIRAVAPHLNADDEAKHFTANEVVDTEGVFAIEGALLLLEGIPADRWGVVTSGSRELARARLARAGLPIPRALVCGDEVSRGKPAPDPYLEAASRLGQPVTRCIAIEDAPAGIQSALGAGMQVVAVASTHPRVQLAHAIIVDRLSDIHVSVTPGSYPALLVSLDVH